MEWRRRPGAVLGPITEHSVHRGASGAAAAAAGAALVFTWLEYPGPARHAVLLIGGAGLVALMLRRLPLLSSVLLALGGGVAVATTSRELFSFWLAGAGLLFLAARPLPGGRVHDRVRTAVAAGAGAAGVCWAVTHQTRDLLTPLFSVAVAAIAVALVRTLVPLLGRQIRLQDEAHAMRRLAAETEADNRELARRAQLARELHDSLGHHVTAMVVQAEAGQVGSPAAALQSIGDLGREAMTELESVLFELRSGPVISFDLGTIDTKLAQPLRDAGTRVVVELATTVDDAALQRTVYRIVQEALTNVMRHASADEVRVEVLDLEGDLVVRVADDGLGLPADVVRGAGLAGIVARAQEHGGRVQLLDVDPHGLLVEVRLGRAGC